MKKQNEKQDVQLVDADTLAARYGLASRTVRKWGNTGIFPVVKLTRRAVRYNVAACDKIIEQRTVHAISDFQS